MIACPGALITGRLVGSILLRPEGLRGGQRLVIATRETRDSAPGQPCDQFGGGVLVDVFVPGEEAVSGRLGHPHEPMDTRRNVLIASAADNFQNELLDTEPLMGGAKLEDYLIEWMRWPHLNEQGHRVVAYALAKMIEPRLADLPSL